MITYDKYYLKEQSYFGEPYDILIELFENMDTTQTVVDLGAGQGRNSIPIANLGYEVTVVDTSLVGLSQIQKNNSNIDIVCSDIYEFDISKYDIVLLDSMFHFYKKDFKKESKFISNLVNTMKYNSIMVNAMIASHSKYFDEIISNENVEIVYNKEFDTHFQRKYRIYVLKKKKGDGAFCLS